MKVKFLNFWLTLLFSFFSNVSFAEPEKSSVWDAIQNLAVEQQAATDDVKKTPIPVDYSYSELNNKINANKGHILKNRATIKNNSAINKNYISTLNKDISDNKVNIDNISKQIKKTRGLRNSVTSEITQTNKNVEKNNSLIKQNQKNIGSIEDNSLSNQKILLEHLRNSADYKAEVQKFSKILNEFHQSKGLTSDFLDRFWVLIAAALVFFMQAGFKTFESGMVRKVHSDNIAIKNILDWLIISLVYFVIGFGFMFGDSQSGFIGTNLFAPTFSTMNELRISIEGQTLGIEFFLYQLAFAATAATIVSGAMSERVALIPYIVLSAFIGIFIYPLFGHWAWGGTYLQTDQGWLYSMGFRDFAGSTVVHSMGAWVALAGIIEIGPRIGRFDRYGNLNGKDFIPSNLGYSAFGVLILWFGWWGFNGGSQLKYDENIASIILNTILAGSAAGLTAFFQAISKSRSRYDIFPKLLGGILGGLVAITACCNSVSPGEAIIVGAIAGFVHNWSYDFLLHKLKLDDPVGAVAVHGFCGVWGTMCVAFFGDLQSEFFSQSSTIFFLSDNTNIRIKYIFLQFTGIATAFLYSFTLSYLFFKLIKKIPGVGLRVLPSAEKEGSLLGISN